MTRAEMYQTVRDSLSDCYVDALDALAALEAEEREAELNEQGLDVDSLLKDWRTGGYECTFEDFCKWAKSGRASSAAPPAPPAAECAAQGVLRQIQWCSSDEWQLCPLCDQCEKNGHSPDCLVGAALAAPCGCQRLREELEYWRLEFAKRIGLPIDDSGDNTHWACIAMGRIDVLEQQLMKNGYKSAIAEWEAELAQLRAELAAAKSEIARLRKATEEAQSDAMIAHLWFAAQFGEVMNGRDFAVKTPMADEAMRGIAAELRQAVDALRPFEEYYRKRDRYPTDPEYAIVAGFVAAYDAKHRERRAI